MNVAKSLWSECNSPADLVAEINDPAIRLLYVINRLTSCARANKNRIPDKVANAASRLMSGKNGWAYWLCKRVRGEQGSFEPDFVGDASPLPMQMVGYIYFASSPLRPLHLKIGFTTRIPQVRIKSLMSNSGEELSLVGAFVGTLIEEQIFHVLNKETKIVGEWYRDPLCLPRVPFLDEWLRANSPAPLSIVAATGEPMRAYPMPPGKSRTPLGDGVGSPVAARGPELVRT